MTGKWTLTLLLFGSPPPAPLFSCIYTSSVAGRLSKLFVFKLTRPIRLWETMSQWKRYHHSPSPARHRERSHTTSGGAPKRCKIPDSVPSAAESSLGFNPLFVTANSKRHGEDQWPGLHHRVSLRTTFGNSPAIAWWPNFGSGLFQYGAWLFWRMCVVGYWAPNSSDSANTSCY